MRRNRAVIGAADDLDRGTVAFGEARQGGEIAAPFMTPDQNPVPRFEGRQAGRSPAPGFGRTAGKTDFRGGGPDQAGGGGAGCGHMVLRFHLGLFRADHGLAR